MQNRIAQFFDLPADVTDGRWHILTIDGSEYEYRAAHAGYGEGMYRHRAGYGVPNPCFGLSAATSENTAARIGFYLKKYKRGVKRADAIAAANSARLEAHRPK